MPGGKKPLLLTVDKTPPVSHDREDRPRKERSRKSTDKNKRTRSSPEQDFESVRYRIEVGYNHGVKPGNIVGAIANEAGLDGGHIGQIEIENEFSLVSLPEGMPKEIFMDLKKVQVCGQPLKISRLDQKESGPKAKAKTKSGKKKPKRKRDKAKSKPRRERKKPGKA